MDSIKILLISALVLFFIILATTTGCYKKDNCPLDEKYHNQIDWEDSDEWHKIWYNEIDTNSNGEDDILEYHGKEGESEYGEYKSNKCLEW